MLSSFSCSLTLYLYFELLTWAFSGTCLLIPACHTHHCSLDGETGSGSYLILHRVVVRSSALMFLLYFNVAERKHVFDTFLNNTDLNQTACVDWESVKLDRRSNRSRRWGQRVNWVPWQPHYSKASKKLIWCVKFGDPLKAWLALGGKWSFLTHLTAFWSIDVFPSDDMHFEFQSLLMTKWTKSTSQAWWEEKLRSLLCVLLWQTQHDLLKQMLWSGWKLISREAVAKPNL